MNRQALIYDPVYSGGDLSLLINAYLTRFHIFDGKRKLNVPPQVIIRRYVEHLYYLKSILVCIFTHFMAKAFNFAELEFFHSWGETLSN